MTQTFDDLDRFWDDGRAARPASPAPAAEPLYEGLRKAYLLGNGNGGGSRNGDSDLAWRRYDDTDEWAADRWPPADNSDEWARADDISAVGPPDVGTGAPEHRSAASVSAPEVAEILDLEEARASHLQEVDLLDLQDGELLDLDEIDAFDEGPEELGLARRAGRRGRGGHGRVARRRTTTLLNATTVLTWAAVALAAVALGGWIVTSRLLTTRQLFFLTHSTFGIVIVHAFGGGLGALITRGESRLMDRIRTCSTMAMAVVAWLASAVGTWFGYAGYRAAAPPGADLSLYPREYLLRSPNLAIWETFAMEWKVHIGWTTPFLATAVAFVAVRYRRRLVADAQVRKVLTVLFILAFAGALVAAGLGAIVNVAAPNDFMHRAWRP